MARFSWTVRSDADISADRGAVWTALTDPNLLPRLTPFLRSISVDGDTWRWTMTAISALGVSVAPSFTEQMFFDEPNEIRYTHRPPAGAHERAGAEGTYRLSDVDGGTHLAIELTLCVELPLPRAAAPAVHAVMRSVMDRTGERFAANLLRHLDAQALAAA